jgi:hypothetical protein
MVPPSGPEGHDVQGEEGVAAEPAIRGKGIDIDIVRILAKSIVEMARVHSSRLGDDEGMLAIWLPKRPVSPTSYDFVRLARSTNNRLRYIDVLRSGTAFALSNRLKWVDAA